MAGVAVVGVFDYASGIELRVFPLYFAPIVLAGWRLSRWDALAAAVASAATWVFANAQAGMHGDAPTWIINTTTQLFSFALVGGLIAELRSRLRRELELNRRDPLTGLLNRRAFTEQAEDLLSLMRRVPHPITLAYLDLDHFKEVNDRHGHHVGDEALCLAAQTFRGCLRATDLLARLGGDEFAVLLPDTTDDAARTALERVRTRTGDAMRARGWPVTVTIGAVAFARSPPVVAAAMQAADELMYVAKKRGRDYVEIAGAPSLDAAPA